MQYQRFDPTGCAFPHPKVPVLPPLSRQSLGHAKVASFMPLGSDGKASFFTRGRYALTEAYRLAGLDQNSALLAPAYHCRTMLDPAIRLGTPIALYPLNADLSPNLGALATCLAACQKPVKAMLLTHYFGFPQDLKSIVDFCAQHGITLIEDCSHALFISADSAATTSPNHLLMGKTGRFGVASPYKFFSSEDGGLLWTNAPNSPPLTKQTPQPLKQELKGIVHALQRARTNTVIAVTAKQSMHSEVMDCHVVHPRSDDAPTGQDTLEQSTTTSPYYQSEHEHLQSLACSRWVVRHTDVQRLTDLRRRHYQQWANAVAGLPHCRAMFPVLPANCVPYMFPLYIDEPEAHFFALKQLGMPIWRWDDIAVSDCPVASDYRLHLLHLPCHQELSTTQMTWMTTTLQNVMQRLPNGRQS